LLSEDSLMYDRMNNEKFDWATFMPVMFFHVVAVVCAASTISMNNLIAFAVLYMVTGLGITLGFHRYFTHNSFIVESNIVKVCMAVMGSLALQGSLLDWVRDHWLHHLYSDQELDPHSSREGFNWCHWTWLFYPIAETPAIQKMKSKLASDPIIAFFSNTFVFVGLQVVLGLVLLAIGGWGMVVWGIFVRTVAVWHVTWLINSACHMWGYTNFSDTGDNSHNLWWAAILTNGEGWHNNHHHSQASPRHGLRPWEFDLTWIIISTMEKFGLAKINHKLIPKLDP
jgi:sn-1 stearoyl-lipid 9-desaturase